ncbi:MAG: glycoside hydrolase family 2 [Ruminococcaceae bacterium]|nr:glycoside hydrolase family 2 [Oscillospiraceae bacterium]
MIPWNEYPRPQLRRNSFFCLNGEWDFAVGDEVYDRTIQVPFCPESALSGIGEVFPAEKMRYYRRTFTLPDGFANERVLLHFGAVDTIARVTLNGVFLGEHAGGYDAFYFDVTDALRAENLLEVAVEERLDGVYPYGKQTRTPHGMWYTPVSGLWQTVWLESVPCEYICGIKFDVTLDTVTVTAEGVSDGTFTVGDLVAPLQNGTATLTISHPRHWTPETPHLYDCTITTATDHVESYFALRTLTTETVNGVPRLCLNGKPYFFHGLLDQGYWQDGLFTPATPAGYAADIQKMKALGFNMLRKHIKVEPARFYYDCDRLGMAVFQDMVNNGDYRFLRDTALPTVGFLRRNDRRLHRDPATREAFVRGMERVVQQLQNHPCVVYWTIFNEGWGQFCGDEMYTRLKVLDGSRFVDTTSGWFLGAQTQVDSRHIYFRRLQLRVKDKPLVLSEFGGYSYQVAGHVYRTDKNYGYGKYNTREDFVAALRRLYTDEVLPLVRAGLSAAVYTQVSDVEEETNGLMTYDRAVDKVLPTEFADISEQLTME